MMKTKKSFLMVIVIALSITTMFAQPDWQKPIKPNEEYKGIVTDKVDAGWAMYTTNGWVFSNGSTCNDHRETKSDYSLYLNLLLKARSEYNDYELELRDFRSNSIEEIRDRREHDYKSFRYYQISATVVKPIPKLEQKQTESEIDPLTKAINKALQDIREGSRLALDQIKIVNGDKEDFKDKVVEILLDEGYKVVAKDYLEKLYEEQKAQQSGIYNERTTVQENNFSAVGYYINVKQTETAIKVQVINVSTGEYEANVTVNL